eukprot:CAMPEP_0206221394 /NCGR_PEP_ID=MMETSP0047_2-20121206/5390_1 /ASSEMBLY_ACC=CAM_ASM_000192 /TAXON_ID=195065 /ORGANISM="Chroomonas mesostigmatica_cf, Strain CCMP1168" /LENGTH=351 /DNA_ID=CAMNT_0053644123 /DNA_START=107 /DNA_END=1163 /DNA_ORIENTATION=-
MKGIALLLLCLLSGSVARPPLATLNPKERSPVPACPGLREAQRASEEQEHKLLVDLEQWLEASSLRDDSRAQLMSIFEEEELTSVGLVLGAIDGLKTRQSYQRLPLGSAMIFEDHVYWTRNVDAQDQRCGQVGGPTALMMAAKSGQTDVVRFLLEKGANVNLRNNEENTALMLAADGGHTDIVRSLLENGAQVDMKGEWSMGGVRVQSGEKGTALMLAARKGYSEIVSALLEKGANVDLQSSPSGWTALILSAEDGHTEVVGALLMHGENGAKVDLRTTDGGTALLWAVRGAGSTDVVKTLIQNERIGKEEIDKALQELGVGQFRASAARNWSQALEDVLKYRRMFLENRE